MKTFCCYSCNSITNVFISELISRLDQALYEMPAFYENTRQKFINKILFINFCILIYFYNKAIFNMDVSSLYHGREKEAR